MDGGGEKEIRKIGGGRVRGGRLQIHHHEGSQVRHGFSCWERRGEREVEVGEGGREEGDRLQKLQCEGL